MIQYITPQQFDIAKSNGISRQVLEYRVYDALWDVERAITESPRAIMSRGDWVKIAKRNGICQGTFYNRVTKSGWSNERAATEPVHKRGSNVSKAHEARRSNSKIPQYIKDLAKSNGVDRGVLSGRIYKLKWDLIKAATTPVRSKTESLKLARKGYEKINGYGFGHKR